MTRKTKATLASMATAFMLCVCCAGFGLWGMWFFNSAVVSGPKEAQTLGAEIADYTLPPDYAEIFGVRLFGTQMVVIAQEDVSPGSMLIMLTKPPESSNITQAELEAQLTTALNQQFAFQQLNLAFDKVETRTINGQEVELTYRAGSDGAGTPYRQMSVLIESAAGPIFVLAQGTEAEWDQHALDSFLNSIR